MKIYGVILTYSYANVTLLVFKVKTVFRVYICDKRNCLSEIYMDGFIQRYVLIKLIGVLDRTVFYTGSTTPAYIFYNVSWLSNQGYLEISRLAFYAFNFSIGQGLYIDLPADLDQLGREYSHGAVIGGKSLVKLSHLATE